MRIAIVGAGGVGGYFGGRLAQAGADVIFFARGRTLQSLRANGLQVESINGDFVVKPVQANDDPQAIGEVDAILVSVKSWQLPDIVASLRPLMGPDTMLVPLLNGVDAATQLTDVFGPKHVLGGLCGLISYIVTPGHIRHTGAVPFITFGELDNRASERVGRLLNTFATAKGVDATVPDNIQVAMWSKFLLIASWSGIGAITRAPVGEFIQLPQTRQLLLGAMHEVFNVARARGVALSESIIPTTLDFLDHLPASATASMQRDIMAGQRSELESQTGAVVRLGAEAGIETPVNAFIYQCLLPQEHKAVQTMENPGV